MHIVNIKRHGNDLRAYELNGNFCLEKKSSKFTSQTEITNILKLSECSDEMVENGSAMKTKKLFCAKTKGVFRSTRKTVLSSGDSTLVKPIKNWRLSPDVQFLRQLSSKAKPFCGGFLSNFYPVSALAQCFGIMPGDLLLNTKN